MEDALSRLRAEVKAAENPRCSAKETLAMAQTATRLARAVADEGTVEKLARVIDPITFAWGDTPRSGSEAMHSYWEDVEKAKATAQAVLTALAAIAVGGGDE